MSQSQYENTKFSILLSLLPAPKARKQKQLVILQQYLLNQTIFEKVMSRNGSTAIRQIASTLLVKTYEPDEIIYKLPEDIRTFNFVVSGMVNLYSDTDKNLEHRIVQNKNIADLSLYKRIKPTQYFGDKVFTTGRKVQIVCAKAIQKTKVLQLNLIVLHKTFEGIFAFRQLQWVIELLRNVPIFSKIPSKKIERVLEHSNRLKYSKGHVLFNEGTEAKNMLVILQGQVNLKKIVQFPFEQGSKVSRNFDLSILGKFDTLGVQQILQQQPYFSTAICKSDTVTILQINKQIAKPIIQPYCLYQLLDKNKQLWRKRRIHQLQTTVSRNNYHCKTQQKLSNHYISTDSTQFTLEDRQKLSYNEDKYKASLKKKSRNRLSLPVCRDSSPSKSIIQSSTISHEPRNTSQDILQKYMLKKSKLERIQIMKYAYKTEDPQQQSLVKPLFVRKSQAIKNTIRQIKHSRKYVYNYMTKLTQTLP